MATWLRSLSMDINDILCGQESIDFGIIKYLLLIIFIVYNIKTCLGCSSAYAILRDYDYDDDFNEAMKLCTGGCHCLSVCLLCVIVIIIYQEVSLQNITLIIFVSIGALQILSGCAYGVSLYFVSNNNEVTGLCICGCFHCINYILVAIIFFGFIIDIWEADSIICDYDLIPTTDMPSIQPSVMTIYPTFMPSVSPTNSPTAQKTDERKINIIVTISYISIQVLVAILVSVMGAIHVRRCMNEDNIHKLHVIPASDNKTTTENTVNEIELQIEAVDKNSEIHSDKSEQTTNCNKLEETQPSIDEANQAVKQKGFCELWVKTVWKMRGVYGGLGVHSFDVLTDLLVIYQWLQYID
eukprot:23522_1